MFIHQRSVVITVALAGAMLFSVASAAGENSLWQIQQILASKTYVDLTHEFQPGIPRWPGFPDETRKTIHWYEKRPDAVGAGFFSELFTHVGQWGTHVDPPAHFIKGLRSVDQIDPNDSPACRSRCPRRRREKPGLHVVDGAREEVGS